MLHVRKGEAPSDFADILRALCKITAGRPAQHLFQRRQQLWEFPVNSSQTVPAGSVARACILIGEGLVAAQFAAEPACGIERVKFHLGQEKLVGVQKQDAGLEAIRSKRDNLLDSFCYDPQLLRDLCIGMAPGADGAVLAKEHARSATAAALATSPLGCRVHGCHGRDACDYVRGRLPNADDGLDHSACDSGTHALGEATDALLLGTLHRLSEDVQCTVHAGGKGFASLFEAVDGAIDLFHLLVDLLLLNIVLVHG
mmetsp:Transcript_146008/g.206875  ORF Transcript_146008/g.206875 Transcript_146008/m.206875 type:complete len:256 (-) Transcript_146008:760-1527(-)